jgi:predicted GNAT family acetyltransferase
MAIDLRAQAIAQDQRNASLIVEVDDTNLPEIRSKWVLDIVNDAEHLRWEAVLNEDTVAELTYRYVGGRIVLLSTWVAHPYRRQGVATELIARVLDEIRETAQKITIICPVVGEFIARNPEYADLIDTVHPGAGAHPSKPPTSQDEQLAVFVNDVS